MHWLALAVMGCSDRDRPPRHLEWYGGPVLANVKVYAVFWGPDVDPTVQDRIGPFLDDLTDSSHFDWLAEYDTDLEGVHGAPATGQHIGRGTYAGEITIAPAQTSGRVDMKDVSRELAAQVDAGALPGPDDDALLMVFMPPAVTLTDGRDIYCSPNGSCANHTSFDSGGGHHLYGVLPDFGPGSGCQRGCGDSPDWFGDLTGNVSHELIEAVTDPLVDEVAGVGPPMAWYDPAHDEIADMCDNLEDRFAVAGGETWWVQKEFSNREGSCLLARTEPDDYQIRLEPRSVALDPGGTATIAVHSAATAGDPGEISLSVGPLPDGVTASIEPASIAPGEDATLTLSASGSASAIRDAVVAVEAAGPIVHTASALVAVEPGAGP